MDLLLESSGDWDVGRDTVTLGVVGEDDVGTADAAAAAAAAVRRGLDMVDDTVRLRGTLGK